MQKRYCELFFIIQRCKTIRELSRQSGMTISHLSTVTDQWVKEELITKQRKGREADINITEKGKELIQLIDKWDKLSKQENKIKSKEDK